MHIGMDMVGWGRSGMEGMYKKCRSPPLCSSEDFYLAATAVKNLANS
jgi:hypothetical protein